MLRFLTSVSFHFSGDKVNLVGAFEKLKFKNPSSFQERRKKLKQKL